MALAFEVTLSEDGVDESGLPDPFQLSLAAQDDDANSALTWRVVQPPTYGAAGIDSAPAASGEDRAVQYQPDPDYFGPDAFTVEVSDGEFTASAAIQVNVLPVNDLPVLGDLPTSLHLPLALGPRRVPLPGLRSGPPNERDQPLMLTAVSSDPALLPDPQVVGPPEAPELLLEPVVDLDVQVTVTLTISDGQPDNAVTTRSFPVTLTGYRLYLSSISR